MTTRTRLAALGGLVLLSLSACSTSENGYAGFSEALEGGASCEELFEIRNEWDPGSQNVVEANAALREIGCFSSSSTRSDI